MMPDRISGRCKQDIGIGEKYHDENVVDWRTE